MLIMMLLFCFVIGVWLYSGFKDGFEGRVKEVYFCGDSMLNNEVYVGEGNVITEQLKPFLKNYNLHMKAEDGAIISEIYPQIPKHKCDIIILSAGGNDLLRSLNQTQHTNNNLNHIFKQLQTLIQHTTPKCKQLHLLSLYYPPTLTHTHPIIQQWNSMIQQLNIPIINTHQILTQPNDFTHIIEPSIQGTSKLAKFISQNILI